MGMGGGEKEILDRVELNSRLNWTLDNDESCGEQDEPIMTQIFCLKLNFAQQILSTSLLIKQPLLEDDLHN